ncbi:hypothetical protein CERZMDRAFT_89110 [Cercospora zeae-maydis SCOH1-5]|uniref:Uncharacterized protein n=1 Tax=Cercospora zeae-maydis SCOH1-5 TaxID=717836 RepID=A0A6A6F0B5_9PEZI|nr:hypothetical protein CERZMDRAFT_89110 [Cercospora zeae-maydis SCOH1-5]
MLSLCSSARSFSLCISFELTRVVYKTMVIVDRVVDLDRLELDSDLARHEFLRSRDLVSKDGITEIVSKIQPNCELLLQVIPFAVVECEPQTFWKYEVVAAYSGDCMDETSITEQARARAQVIGDNIWRTSDWNFSDAPVTLVRRRQQPTYSAPCAEFVANKSHWPYTSGDHCIRGSSKHGKAPDHPRSLVSTDTTAREAVTASKRRMTAAESLAGKRRKQQGNGSTDLTAPKGKVFHGLVDPKDVQDLFDMIIGGTRRCRRGDAQSWHKAIDGDKPKAAIGFEDLAAQYDTFSQRTGMISYQSAVLCACALVANHSAKRVAHAEGAAQREPYVALNLLAAFAAADKKFSVRMAQTRRWKTRVLEELMDQLSLRLVEHQPQDLAEDWREISVEYRLNPARELSTMLNEAYEKVIDLLGLSGLLIKGGAPTTEGGAPSPSSTLPEAAIQTWLPLAHAGDAPTFENGSSASHTVESASNDSAVAGNRAVEENDPASSTLQIVRPTSIESNGRSEQARRTPQYRVETQREAMVCTPSASQYPQDPISEYLKRDFVNNGGGTIESPQVMWNALAARPEALPLPDHIIYKSPGPRPYEQLDSFSALPLHLFHWSDDAGTEEFSVPSVS